MHQNVDRLRRSHCRFVWENDKEWIQEW